MERDFGIYLVIFLIIYGACFIVHRELGREITVPCASLNGFRDQLGHHELLCAHLFY